MAERRGHPELTADGSSGRISGSGVRAGIVTAALILAVSGCTGAPAPGPSTPGSPGTVLTPSPTTSTTPSATPTVRAPERPAAMDRADADGAIAAATYFIALYSYAYATGDLVGWTAMSDPACVFCAGLTKDVQAASGTGASVVGGDLTVASKTAAPGKDAGVFRVDLTVSQSAFQVINRSGAVTSAGVGSRGATVTAVLVHRREGWLVRAARTGLTTK